MSRSFLFLFVVVAAAGCPAPLTTGPKTTTPPQSLLPAAPTKVVATAGNTQATLTWVSPQGTLTGFKVTPHAGADALPSIGVGSGTQTSVVVQGLTNGTAYTFTVTAENSSGSGPASAPSNAVTPVPNAPDNGLPDAPGSLAAVPGDGQATLSWTEPASHGTAITQYQVQVTPEPSVDAIVVVGTTATVVGLTNGVTYHFNVAASNATGDGPFSSDSNAVTPGTSPAAPSNVLATASNGSASLSWTAPVETGGNAVSGYVVNAYQYVGAAWTLLKSVNTSSAGTTASVTGLINGQYYEFTVAAVNAVGTGATSGLSGTVQPAGVPSAPTAVTATAGDSHATVVWTVPSSNGGRAISTYTVVPYAGSTAGTPVTAYGASASVAGLSNGTAYTFRVYATNPIGNGDAATSNAVTPFSQPSAPTGVYAVAGDSEATVNWTAPSTFGSGTLSGYKVTVLHYQSYAWVTVNTLTTSGSGTSAVASGLVNGNYYSFQVAAVTNLGTGLSSLQSSSVIPGAAPGAPTGVTVTSATNGSVSLSWTAPSNSGGGISYYKVLPMVGGTAGTLWYAYGTTATITGLANGTSYTFQVSAVNSYGTSAAAVSSAVTPHGAASAPTGVLAHPGNGQASVSWTTPASAGDGSISAYLVKTYHYATGTGWTQSGTLTVSGTGTTTLVTGLTNGDYYEFSVLAVTQYGNGTESALSGYVQPGTVPAAPTAVLATAGDGSASVSWTAPSNGGNAITTYTVTPYHGDTKGTAVVVSGYYTSTVVSGLTNGTTYMFRVLATNAIGDGPNSSASSVVTPVAALHAPTNVVATAGTGSATVSWTAATGGLTPSGYQVKVWAWNSGSGWVFLETLDVSSTATSYTVTGLTGGTYYEFAVAGTASGVTGPFSAISAWILAG